MPTSRFDQPPQQTVLSDQDPRWRKWLLDVWQLLQAIGLPLPTAIAVGASPFTYTFTGAGTASVIIAGGSTNLVEWSRDGVTFFTVGVAGGMYTVSQGDRLRVTYPAGAPTMTLVLR